MSSTDLNRVVGLAAGSRLLGWAVVFLLIAVVLVPSLGLRPSALPGASAPSPVTPRTSLAPWTGSVPDAARGPLDPMTHARPSAGGIGQLVVTTPDPAVVPNDGLQVVLSAYSSPTLPPGSSFQVGAEEQIGPYEAVLGLFANSITPPVPFFSVFILQNDSNVHLAYWPSFPLSTGESLAFVLTPTNLTSWRVQVNGELFGDNASLGVFDFGVDRSTVATNLSFAETAIFSGSSTTPSRLDVPVALSVRLGGTWYLPHGGSTDFSGGSGNQWGVEGRLQRSTLAPGELQTGSGVANVTNGTLLWSGGSVPIDVTLTLGVSSARALTLLPWTVSTTYPSGGVVPNVALLLSDGHNGTFLPDRVTTGSTGVAGGLFEAPNVSATVGDPLNGAVATLGYNGSGVAVLTVIPAIQALFAVSPTSPSLLPGGSLSITFSVADSNGTPISGVAVTFATSGGAGLSAVGGVTSALGTLTIVLFAPSHPVDLQLNASVASEGYWGSIGVPVHVGAASPSFYQTYGGWIVVIGVVATVTVVLALIARERRRKRQPIPEMGIRRHLLEERRRQAAPPPAAPAPPEGPPPPISRTPP